MAMKNIGVQMHDSYEPLEARGEDPEIDHKATEEQFYQNPYRERCDQSEDRIRKFSETIIEASKTTAEKIADGSRQISDHCREGGTAIATVIFGDGYFHK